MCTVGRRHPAVRVAAYQLQAALRDQETAIRGYLIAADPQFLAPYYDGQQSEQQAAQDIRRLLGGRPELIADLDAVEQAAAKRRAQALRRAADRRGHPPAPRTSSTALPPRAGKGPFDAMQTLFDTQNQNLGTARTAAIDQTRPHPLLARRGARGHHRRVRADRAFALAIPGPVAPSPGRSARSPRPAGESPTAVSVSGSSRRAPDIRAIASDVEDVRRRIVDELDSAGQARPCSTSRPGNCAGPTPSWTVRLRGLPRPAGAAAQGRLVLPAAGEALRDQLDERGIQYIDFAVDGAKRMQILINDLLTFSGWARLNATQTEVDLNTTLEQAISNVATAVEESGAQIDRPDELPPVTGDPTLLIMLWQNLIANAIKFRREDRPPASPSDTGRAAGEQDGDWLFSVSDNGIGIADEFVDKVFVIFQRLHGRDAYAGTGIGLALVKKIVEYHGGTIWIDTDYSGGTRFRFTLPMVAAGTPEAQPAQLEGTAP